MDARRVVTTFTPAEYLAMEAVSAEKHELVDGQILSMAGGSRLHSATCQEIGRLLGNALRERACTVFQSDMRLHVAASSSYFYPDLQVVCGEATGPDDRTVDNPTVIVEVLSPNTADFDRGVKVVQYQRLVAVRDIVLVDPEQKRVEHWWRGPDGGWRYVDRVADELRLTGCDVSLPMAEVFPNFPAIKR